MEGAVLIESFCDNYALMVFDWRGCGNNESQFVTLGLRESEDLDLIINYVVDKTQYKNVSLWGRSMGAATIIHYLHNLSSHLILNQYHQIVKKVKEIEKSPNNKANKLRNQIKILKKKLLRANKLSV